MIHFAQMAISKAFQMYDYGSDNILHYNQSTAPLYDVKNINTPVALYYGQDDWLADPTDVEYLKNNLPNIKDDYSISSYAHLDFTWAQNASQVLYNRMIQLMLSVN
jgi:lysosomal acid lipase/cholesteryl ester hydrolase